MKINVEVKLSIRVNEAESLFISFEAYSAEHVAKIKGLPERYYTPDTKEWEVPLSLLDSLKETCKDDELILSEAVEQAVKTIPQTIPPKKINLADTTFKVKPYRYQLEGIQHALDNPKYLLCDEQGLGKTKMIIEAARLRKEEIKHCLIICGVSTLKYNWLEEVAFHSDEQAKIIGSKINKKGKLVEGTTKERLADLDTLPDAFFLILNIEALRDDHIRDALAKWISKKEIGMVVIDEAHMVKNIASKQGSAIHRLKYAPYLVGVTGTPIVNKPMDLFNLFLWIGEEKGGSGSLSRFKQQYCYLDDWGAYIGPRNQEELQKRLNRVMLRRTKDEVLDLPEKIYTNVYVDLTKEQTKKYEEIKEGILKRLKGKKADDMSISTITNPLEELNYLRRIVTYPKAIDVNLKKNPKIDRMKELVQDIVDNNEKVIVFSHWKDVINSVIEEVESMGIETCKITGEVKGAKRQEQVNAFQENPNKKVIACTIDAAGVGITLTEASHVIFLDNPWTAAKKWQAEDRAHRIGTKKHVNIMTILAQGTIDERIEEIVREKSELAKSIVDGIETEENVSSKLDKEKIKWLLS